MSWNSGPMMDENDPVAMYRCGAAHVDDPDPCGGPVVVMVVDQDKAGARGCEHHGARLLASLQGASVYGMPDAPIGTAIRVFKAASQIEPFIGMAEVVVSCQTCGADVCQMCLDHRCSPKCGHCGGTCSCTCGFCPDWK